MKKTWKLLIALAITLPACAMADDFTSTMLNNSSDLTLKQNFLWGKECMLNSPEKEMVPGGSSNMHVKPGCKFAGIRYDVYKNNTKITTASVAHTFNEGKFSVGVSTECVGPCHFTGVPQE
jgi:hypothetical protein